jgi:signal transduction histidine kinase
VLKTAVGQALGRKQDLHVEYRIVLPDRSIRWMESHGKLELDSSGEPLRFRGTCMNITERKQAEQITREVEASRALAAGLLHGQENERRRLARELHDDFTQRVVVLSMEVGRLIDQMSDIPEVAGDLEKASEKLVTLAEDIREVSHRLHPGHLDHLQLSSAIEAECQAFAEREEIEVSFSAAKAIPDIPRETRLALYRITQEAFQNVARHANASQVRVTIGNEDAGLCLRIHDNGVGFNLGALRQRKGLGLVSMKERVRAVDGTVRIDSSPGEGTTVSVFINL